MNWVRSNYERAIVFAAAAFLLLTALFIWLRASGFDENFAALQTAPPPKTAAPPPKAVELEQAIQKIKQPPQWTFTGRSGLFVPEKHFIGANGVPATLQNTQVHPPVPNEWFEQFGLSIADADVLTQDADSDGFSNLDEWQGKTNPSDPASHPPYPTKLAMKSFSKEAFPLIFSSWVGDTFGINTIDRQQPTQFLRTGENVRGTRFKIASFAEKYAPDKYGTDVDVSELTLEQEETHEQVVLVKERPSISPESVATFVYTWGERREFSVKKDQEFSLKPEEQIKYKLIDVQPDKAIIVNSQNPKESLQIPLQN